MGIIETTSTFAQFVARASEVLPNITPNAGALEIDPGEKARSIAEKLEDFCVPQTLRDLLTPSLGELGFEINTVQLNGLPGTPPGSHNVIENRAGHRSLLHFPKAVLEDPLVWQSVGNVFQRLNLRNEILLILSEGLGTTHPFYRGVGQRLWQDIYKVTAPFLPWTDLMPSEPMAKSDLLTVLPALLQLEDLITEARILPPIKVVATNITPAEVTTLANILGQLPEFFDSGPTGWRVYMNQAGLSDLIGNLSLSGATTIMVAFGLITQLNNHKVLPDLPEDQVLGRFLRAVLTITDLRTAEKVQINNILETYNLTPSFRDD